MGSCNTTANEKGGKDLLLKVCKEVEVNVAVGTGDEPTHILLSAHGLEVGDLVRFGVESIGTNSDVVVGTMYYVKAVPNANAFTISLAPGGAVVTFTSALTALSIEVFQTLGGLRSKGFSFASEGVDVSNHGTNQWRKMLDGAGIKSASISGEGVYTSAANYRALEVSAFANQLVCLAFVDVVGGRIYVGCFKITAIEASAEYDGEATYSMSAESAGEVEIKQAS
jgi:TP901-1 family phage major tail protein